jgi:hypothetical protein
VLLADIISQVAHQFQRKQISPRARFQSIVTRALIRDFSAFETADPVLAGPAAQEMKIIDMTRKKRHPLRAQQANKNLRLSR